MRPPSVGTADFAGGLAGLAREHPAFEPASSFVAKRLFLSEPEMPAFLTRFYLAWDAAAANEWSASRGDPVPVEPPAPFDDAEYPQRNARVAKAIDAIRLILLANASLFESADLACSLATGDAIDGFSDVDLFVTLRRETVSDPGALRAARTVLMNLIPHQLAVCPLALHHTFAMSAHEHDAYALTYRPPLLYVHARRLLGEQAPIRVRALDAPDAARAAFIHNAHGDFATTGDRPDPMTALYGATPDAWPIKAKFWFVHRALSFPLFFTQAIGRPCYKREAFGFARPFFDPDVFSVIDEISAFRSAFAAYAPSGDAIDLAGDAADRTWFARANGEIESAYREAGTFGDFDRRAASWIDAMRRLANDALAIVDHAGVPVETGDAR
ncbi:hypothetical protein K8I61_07910 [bacterium]|nr:hypothetical protein [bacterium]